MNKPFSERGYGNIAVGDFMRFAMFVVSVS
jgi:hypothetical protein